MTPKLAVKLACPKCKSTRLRSDEVSTTAYPVTLTRNVYGTVEVEYTGSWSETYDEGTVYSGDIWCLDCMTQLSESELVPE